MVFLERKVSQLMEDLGEKVSRLCVCHLCVCASVHVLESSPCFCPFYPCLLVWSLYIHVCCVFLVCLFVFCMFNVCLYVQTSQVERLERELDRERRYSSQLMEQVHTLTYVNGGTYIYDKELSEEINRGHLVYNHTILAEAELGTNLQLQEGATSPCKV